MATIAKRTGATGVKFQAKVRVRGYPPESATFPTRDAAKKWAKQIEAAMLEGRHFKAMESKRHTLGEAIDRYCQSVLPTSDYKPAERLARVRQLEVWRSILGRYLLSDLTAARLAEARDKLLRTPSDAGEKRGPATVTRAMAVLSVVLNTCQKDWGWIQSNPMKEVTKPKVPSGRVRCLSDDERKRLLAALEEVKDPLIKAVVLIGMCSGARRSEITGLQWKYVDLDKGTAELVGTKNGERRIIPIIGPALEALKAYKAGLGHSDDDSYIFPRKDGLAPLDTRKRWESIREKAQLEDFRFHDLRHTCASYLAMNGATLPELSSILGHKTIQMVKRYAHLTDEHNHAVAKRMTEKVFG